MEQRRRSITLSLSLCNAGCMFQLIPCFTPPTHTLVYFLLHSRKELFIVTTPHPLFLLFLLSFPFLFFFRSTAAIEEEKRTAYLALGVREVHSCEAAGFAVAAWLQGAAESAVTAWGPAPQPRRRQYHQRKSMRWCLVPPETTPRQARTPDDADTAQ